MKPSLAFLIALLLNSLAVGQGSSALSPKSPIPLTNVEGRMDHFSVDVRGERLFVAGNANHTVEVIDLRARRQAHTIPNLDTPQGLFYDASTHRLFVANEGDGSVKIFDGTAFHLLKSVKLAADSDNIRYDARSKHVIVGYGGEKFLGGKAVRGQGESGGLAILDSAGKKTGEIAIDAHPESFQLEKAGTRIFVNVPDRREVEVIDLVKGSVLVRWPVTVCAENFPMALDEAHHRLFVGCRAPARLAVFDTENGKIVASPAIVGHTDDLFFDASKNLIYILGDGFIEAFQEKDPDSYGLIGRYPTPYSDHTGLFVPELRELFEAVPHRGKQRAEILVYEAE